MLIISHEEQIIIIVKVNYVAVFISYSIKIIYHIYIFEANKMKGNHIFSFCEKLILYNIY